MVWATTTAAGRYIEKPLCLARTARPEKAAVVSDKLIKDGTGDEHRHDQRGENLQSRVKKMVPPRRKRPPVLAGMA